MCTCCLLEATQNPSGSLDDGVLPSPSARIKSRMAKAKPIAEKHTIRGLNCFSTCFYSTSMVRQGWGGVGGNLLRDAEAAHVSLWVSRHLLLLDCSQVGSYQHCSVSPQLHASPLAVTGRVCCGKHHTQQARQSNCQHQDEAGHPTCTWPCFQGGARVEGFPLQHSSLGHCV